MKNFGATLQDFIQELDEHTHTHTYIFEPLPSYKKKKKDKNKLSYYNRRKNYVSKYIEKAIFRASTFFVLLEWVNNGTVGTAKKED